MKKQTFHRKTDSLEAHRQTIITLAMVLLALFLCVNSVSAWNNNFVSPLEQNTVSDGTAIPMGSNFEIAQQFTIGYSTVPQFYSITKASIMLTGLGIGETITARIMNVSTLGVPSGVLGTATSTYTVDSQPINFTFSNVRLSPSTSYFLVITKAAAISTANASGGNPYGGGDLYLSSDTGATWAPLTGTDAYFTIDGEISENVTLSGFNGAGENQSTYTGSTMITVTSAQTFTMGTTGLNVTSAVDRIVLFLGAPDPAFCNVSIRNVDGTGQPTGSDLAISNNVQILTYSYHSFNFSSPIILTAGTKYAYLTSCNDHYVYYRNSTNSYSGGTFFWKSGSSWTDKGYDAVFWVYLSNKRVRYFSVPSSVSFLTAAYLNLSSLSQNITNPSLLIANNNRVWNYAGAFNQSNNRTNNFYSTINQYLTSAYLVGSNYLIPFVFYSDTVGILQYSDLLLNNEGILVNSISYNTPTYETKSETFTFNFSVGDIISANAIFNYNGTNYTSTVSCANHYCLAVNTLEIPLITPVQQNNSFYWIATIFYGNTSYTETTQTNNQTVNQISMTQCTNGTIALNFTSYDEQNRTRINPFSFDGTFDYYLGSGSSKRTISITNSSTPEVNLCINYNSTYYIDAIIAYEQTSSTAYPTRNHFYQRYPISNATQKIPLYSLKSGSSTSFILQVQDSVLLPMKGVLVNAKRCYVGLNTNETVFISRTDTSGLTTGNLEAETALYQFYITLNNSVLLAVTPCMKVVPQTVPYTLLFQIGTPYVSPFLDIDNVTDVTSEIFYNQTSNLLIWTYVDTSGDFINASLEVYGLNHSGNSAPLSCSDSSTLTAATLTCAMPNAGTYSARAYVHRTGRTLIDQVVFEVQTFASTVGYYGVFLSFFLILISGFAFKWSEIAGIWMINVSVIICNLIQLVSFGPVFITAMLAISVIITAVLER